MANCAIINALGLSSHALEPLYGGKSAIDYVANYISSLPDTSDCVYLIDQKSEPLRDDLTARMVAGEGVVPLLEAMKEISEGYDNTFYLFADCPLYDTDATARMLKNHIRYYAQYTFADGYPFGITPEILRSDVLSRLITLTGDENPAVCRTSLFDLIQKDINSFDIETDLAPKDMRMLRVSLSCDSKRNAVLTRRIMEAGGTDTASVLEILESKPELLRTLPAFANIQIVDGCPQSCTYCPFPLMTDDVTAKRGFMDVEEFSAVAQSIAQFSGDAVLSVSLWGEPSLHPHIYQILESAASIPGLSMVVETSAIGWAREHLDALSSPAADRCTWIISLDARNAAEYEALRGAGWEEASSTTEYLIGRFGSKVFVQAVRMVENEINLEGFYRHWKEKTENVIIQKYDNFAGFLPDRQVTDISPLKRNPCWHLKRDLTILLDGTVTMCREDLGQQHILGNILSERIEDIWARGEKEYLLHLSEHYPEICTKCDEYYTYNF